MLRLGCAAGGLRTCASSGSVMLINKSTELIRWEIDYLVDADFGEKRACMLLQTILIDDRAIATRAG